MPQLIQAINTVKYTFPDNRDGGTDINFSMNLDYACFNNDLVSHSVRQPEKFKFNIIFI